MRFETVLNATLIVCTNRWQQYRKFRAWLLRRDEQQRTEIARLQAELDADDLMAGEAETFKPEYEKQLESENAYLKKQLRTERSILDNAPVWAEMANCPPETVIGIRYGRILEYQAEITRLQAQVATLERIITSNVEDSGHVGDSAKPYMNEVKTEIPSVGFIDEYSEEAILARMKEEEHD